MAVRRTDYTLRGISVKTLDDLRLLVALSRANNGPYSTMKGIMDAALAAGARVLSKEVRGGR